MIKIPIYEYECIECGFIFERIEKMTSFDWKKNDMRAIECDQCYNFSAYRRVSGFKIGSKVLDTRDKSGYQTDALTLGKIIDEGGIPYEFKAPLREKQEMITRSKQYTKELKERGKRYGFDPFSND